MEKRQKTIALAVIIAVLVVSIGVTVAYFVAPITRTNQTTIVTTGTLKLTFSDISESISKTMQFGESITRELTVENTGTLDVYATIYWKNLVNTYLLGSMVYSITYGDSTADSSTYVTPITNQNIPRSTSASSNQTIIENVLIPANKTYKFILTIKLIDSPSVNQTEDLNATLYTEFTIKEGSAPVIASSPVKCLDANGDELSTCPASFNVGDRLAIGTEQFRYIGSRVENGVTYLRLFAEYNLNIDGRDGSNNSLNNHYGNSADGFQNENVKGYIEDEESPSYNNENFYGTTAFSNNTKKGTNYSDYEGSVLEEYIEDYATLINATYFNNESIVTGEPILLSDLTSETIGCSEEDYECPTNHWVTNTSYWTGTAYNENSAWSVYTNGGLYDYGCHDAAEIHYGVRPVIVIPASLI